MTERSEPLAVEGKVLVFTATYDERDNIEELCRRVLALGDVPGMDLDILVVDDDSPDGTGCVLDRLRTEDARVRPVHRPRKLGLGSAHKLGMLAAIQGGYDVLVTMDADLSHDPADIPRLLEQLDTDDADFAIGSRYADGGACDYRGYRRWVSRAANVAARSTLGVPIHEFTTAFRAFRVPMLRRLDLSSIRSNGYSFFLESVYRIAAAGFRVTEAPIHFRDRHAGRSKIPRLEIVRGMSKLGSLVLSRLRSGSSLPSTRDEPAEARRRLTCYACGNPWVVERFGADGTPNDDYTAYQCTSMVHASKPRVVSCLHCGLEFVPPEEVPAKLESHYADVVDESYVANECGRRRTFERVFDGIRPHLPTEGRRMLEVGCYCGVFLEVARENGWDVRGVEPSRWAADVARAKGFTVHTGTIADEDCGVEPGSLDAIVLWDVLEHVRDPLELLRRANSLLREGGVLCLSTLDVDNWFPRLMGRRWPWYMDMHLFYFSREGMGEIFRSAGFALEHASPYCHYVPARYVVDKLASLAPLAIGRCLGLVRGAAPRSVLVPFRFGDIKLYVARKVTTKVPAGEPAVESSPERAASTTPA